MSGRTAGVGAVASVVALVGDWITRIHTTDVGTGGGVGVYAIRLARTVDT